MRKKSVVAGWMHETMEEKMRGGKEECADRRSFKTVQVLSLKDLIVSKAAKGEKWIGRMLRFSEKFDGCA